MSKAGTVQFWASVHRYLGLVSMLFLFLAASTGCILCFDNAIDAALNPDLFRSPVAGTSLTIPDAIARFEVAHPHLQVTSFPLWVQEGRTIAARIAARSGSPPLASDEAFITPQDGRLVGTRSSGPGWDRRHIVAGVYTFHYTLLAGDRGRWLMGVAALLWLLGNGVGFYLTLPPKLPFWSKWKRSWRIEWRARLRWLLLDVHRASGLWLFAGVMTLAATSVCMNFFDEAFWPVVSTLSPPHTSPLDAPAPASPGPDLIGFSGALAHAERAAAARGIGWKPASETYLSDRNFYMVLLTPSGQISYRWLGPVKLYLDGRTGALVYIDDAYRDSTGRMLNRALYPLHTGEIIGPFGIAIVFLLGLATSEMCVTGFYVWWKKRRSRRAMERAKRAALGA